MAENSIFAMFPRQSAINRDDGAEGGGAYIMKGVYLTLWF